LKWKRGNNSKKIKIIEGLLQNEIKNESISQRWNFKSGILALEKVDLK
jgi:hypothetical protein